MATAIGPLGRCQYFSRCDNPATHIVVTVVGDIPTCERCQGWLDRQDNASEVARQAREDNPTRKEG